MTTHEQLERKIAELHEKMFALQKEIEGVESELVKVKDEEEWPQEDDQCYYISDSGLIEWSVFNESKDFKDTLSIGNVFRTKQEAEFAVERLKVLAEMRKFAFEPDYTSNEKKWFISYDDVDKVVKPDFTYHSRIGITMFRDVVDAEVCISKIGEERLKKYYFGVKEDG